MIDSLQGLLNRILQLSVTFHFLNIILVSFSSPLFIIIISSSSTGLGFDF